MARPMDQLHMNKPNACVQLKLPQTMVQSDMNLKLASALQEKQNGIFPITHHLDHQQHQCHHPYCLRHHHHHHSHLQPKNITQFQKCHSKCHSTRLKRN
jgi:hypothetical protein